MDGFEEFLNDLDEISKKFNVEIMISVSMDADDAPDYVKNYAN